MGKFVGIHEVQDYDAWRTKFDEDEEKRAGMGMRTIDVHRSAANPNEVCIIIEADDMEAADNFANSPDLEARMKEAGVLEGGKYFLGN